MEFRSNAVPALTSTGLVHVQNVDGLVPSDVSAATVGTCADAERFCMREACDDGAAVGTQCYCLYDGVHESTDPLPVG